MVPTIPPETSPHGRIFPVDAIDRKILAELQHDGRLTITELAEKIGLSVSPCHRRLRELERSGVILGYRAIVDAAALGLTFQALVFVTMRQEDRDTLLGFEHAVTSYPKCSRPSDCSVTPTTSYTSSPPTWPPTPDSKTTPSPRSPACNASTRRS